MTGKDIAHSTGVRTSGWAVFALLCLLAQEERGAWFWACVVVCVVWMAVGLYVIAGEMKAAEREMRERLKKPVETRLPLR